MLYELLLEFDTRNRCVMAGRKKTSVMPRKLPAQDRSRATVTAILEAAARILVKDGYDAFTTNRVAEKAGVSIGSLYQYFPSKEALIIELQRRHLREIEQGIEEMASQSTSAPLAEVIRAAVERTVRAHLVNPALHRVLSEEMPPVGHNDWEASFDRRAMEIMRRLCRAWQADIIVPDPDLAAYVVMRAVEATVHDAVSDRPQDVKSGALAEEVTRMIVSYLTGKPLAAVRKAWAAAE
jgi:AcrR family transcriptional regulator